MGEEKPRSKAPIFSDRSHGTWSRINDALRTQIRHRDKRPKSPSMGIIDSQSVKTTEQSGPHGKDAFKKVNGRKRHVVVDTLGMVVAAVVQSAGIQDRDGAKLVLKKLVGRFPRLKKILADGIYNGGIAEWAMEVGGWILELVLRPEGEKEFKVLKWRWIVAHVIRCPRVIRCRFNFLGKNDEPTPDFLYFLPSAIAIAVAPNSRSSAISSISLSMASLIRLPRE